MASKHKTRRRSRKSSRRRKVSIVQLNPRKRHRKSSHRRSRRAAVVHMNPRKRHRRSRRGYRHNPMPRLVPSFGFITSIAQVGAGFYATKVAATYALPMIGVTGDLPRLAVKGVVAWGVAALGGMAFGSRVQENLLVGGALHVFEDAVRTYLAPFVPALAAADGYDMSAYFLPEGGSQQPVSSYYQVGETVPGDVDAL